MRTHVCLISDDPIVNLSPALGERLRADHLAVIAGPTYRHQLPDLFAVAKRYGISSEAILIDDEDDISQSREQILEWLVAYQDKTQSKDRGAANEIFLNVSGGNRPMALAATDVFQTAGHAIFYVNHDSDHVVWLWADKDKDKRAENHANFDIQDRLRLEPFLQAYGIEVTNKHNVGNLSAELQSLCRELILYVDQHQDSVRAMNWLAGQHGQRVRLPSRLAHDRDFGLLCDLFEQAELLERHGNAISFGSEANRFTCRGGWLELYCYQELRRLSSKLPSLQDFAIGVEVEKPNPKNQQHPVRNELDGLALANNRLHIIECKAKNMSPTQDHHADASQAIYKLGTLIDALGGQHAKGMLLSYFPVGRYAKARADSLGIHVCAGRDLQRLREFLLRLLS